jgi:hypothetical protein
LLHEWQFPDPTRFVGYLLLACLGSTLKIRLPKIHGTLSINFLFVLIGVAELSLTETITLGCVAALIQSLWNSRKRPSLTKVLFNIATLTVSIAAAYSAAHALVRTESLVVLLAVAVSVYFTANSGMIALVLALSEQKSFADVWRECFMWSFPYYLAGAAIAVAITVSGQTAGWKTPLLMLPVMYLIYSYYRLYLFQVSQREAMAVS